jgi:membrane-bound lytic murein transglycosylase A
MVHHTMKTSSASASRASSRISHIASVASVSLRGHCRSLALAVAVALLASCRTLPPAPPPVPVPQIKTVVQARYERVPLQALPSVADADLVAAWPAWLASCVAFARGQAPHLAAWRVPCEAALAVEPIAPVLRHYFERHFDAYRIVVQTREDAGAEPRVLEVIDRGRITGYYEPLLSGSRRPDARFRVPLHRPPDDLLTIDLAAVVPELAGRRVRGRLVESPQGRRVVPYWSRAELDGGERLKGHEIVWVDDAIEAFFLQIQGSGRVALAEGGVIRLGYADTNGHPYRSIGRWLVERGELTFEQASMQGIQAWARANPQRLAELLNHNPSYVFFRELPLGDPRAGPVGALNVALTPGYSLAVDPQFVPLGAPLLIATPHPGTGEPLQRLMLAQDTGGAIRGPLRFDFFWGFGPDAGAHAGRQRHDARAWLLVPTGASPADLLRR